MGLRATRSASAKREHPNIVVIKTIAGQMIIKGAVSIYVYPCFSIIPHEAVGGCTPNPKNERADSHMIMTARSIPASTIIGDRILGVM